MNLLYYSTAYHASHGGRHHARAFVQFAREHADVVEVNVFPPAAGANDGVEATSRRGGLQRILDFPLILPLRLWRRNQHFREELQATIQATEPQAIVVRLDNNFWQIPWLRRQFPNLIVATEVNASAFEESYQRIIAKYFFRRQERRALAAAHHNFFVSDHLRQRIMGSALSPRRDHVNQNGVDLSQFFPFKQITAKKDLHTELGLAADQKVIGYVGGLNPYKRIDLIIDAFAQLVDRHNAYHLVVIGGGAYLPELQAYARKAGVGEAVHFLGARSHEAIPKYLRCFDIAVHHAALDYMSPLKLFEYLACRLPVIAPDTPGVREVFVDEEHVLLTAPTVTSIVAQLERLISEPALAAWIAEQGYQLVVNQFSWAENVNRIIRALEESIREQP